MAVERAPVTAFVALGANLGDAAQALEDAIKNLACLPQTRLIGRSPLYRTGPVGASGPDYINAVAEISTALNAQDLLLALQHLEAAAGRQRPYANAPRTLDLDLLLFGDAFVQSATLSVPHPRLTERAFVLVPLSDLAPHLVSQAQLKAVAGQAITRL